MKEMKHTPGPWMVMDGTYGFGTELGVCEVETEYFVAGIVADIPKLEDQARANANLIAAAPEMLEALKSAEGILSRTGDTEWACGSLAEIRAVIAKATL